MKRHTSHNPGLTTGSRRGLEIGPPRRATLPVILLRSQVSDDLVDHGLIDNEGHNPHLAVTARTHQRVDLVGSGFKLHLLQ